MFRTKALFLNYQNVDIEITIKAPFHEWKELLDSLNQDKWPDCKLHENIKEVVYKLVSQVDSQFGEKHDQM